MSRPGIWLVSYHLPRFQISAFREGILTDLERGVCIKPPAAQPLTPLAVGELKGVDVKLGEGMVPPQGVHAGRDIESRVGALHTIFSGMSACLARAYE
jgi:hypothetical protein